FSTLPHTLLRSITVSAAAPTSCGACSPYRKSVQSIRRPAPNTSTPADPVKPVSQRMLARLVTIIRSRPASAIRAMVRACRTRRRSLIRDVHPDRVERQQVTLCAQSGDHSDREIGDDRMMPHLFTPEDVAEVHLDERQRRGEEGITDRE